MHIVLLNDDFPPRGESSPAIVAQNLKRGYERKGHKVTVITTHRKEVSSGILRDRNTVSLPVSYRPSLRQWKCLYMRSVAKMLHVEMEKLKPDVVHAHNIHHYLTYNALRIARASTPRVFFTAHDVMSFAFGRLNTKRFLASGGIDTRLTIFDHLRSAELQFNPLRNPLIRSTINKNVRNVIAPSQALARALNDHGILCENVIPNGMDLNEWKCTQEELDAFRNKYALKERKIILFGGRLSIDKGAFPLLQALDAIRKEITEVVLFVAGETRRWEGIAKAAKVSGELTSHVINPGWLSHDEMRMANFAADVIVVSSLCLDVFPSANIEAMAAGKPVVGTIFGGTPEVIVDGITGFIRNPLKQDEFTDALLIILKDEEWAQRMGKAGRKQIEENYSLEKQTEKYLELFEGS